MNEVILKGIIRDIQPSHTINGINYDKANIIVSRKDGTEDILSLKFKQFSNFYREGDLIELVGHLRSYSVKTDEDKSHVELYVFTYFDTPSTDVENYQDIINKVTIDGRVCKTDMLRYTKSGKPHFHFILANNIFSGGQKINNYIPAVVWGKQAIKASTLKVNDRIYATGELHSRVYKKVLPDGELEIRTAHELVIQRLDIIDETNI